VGALWTLPIELAFYALILLLIAAQATSRMAGLAYALILVSLPYLVGSSLSIVGLVPFDVPSLGYGYLNLTFVRHGCFFGLGILLFLATEQGAPPTSPMRRFMIALAVLLSCLEIIGRAAELAPAYRHGIAAAPLSVEAVPVFLAGTSAIWAFARHNTRINLGVRSRELLRKLGLMSYPIYLMHEAIGGTLIGYLDERGMNPILAQVAGAVVVMMASLIVVRYLEPRAKKLLMRVVDPVIIAIERLPLFGRRLTAPPPP
jgi:peptidoglycan/LPS O-acetylase OafA/YrhL